MFSLAKSVLLERKLFLPAPLKSFTATPREATCHVTTRRPAYPYAFVVLCTLFAPIVRLYAEQRLLYDII